MVVVHWLGVLGVVAVGALALGLSWLSRRERSALLTFGAVGFVCIALVIEALVVSAPWMDVVRGVVAGLGVVVGGLGVALAGGIAAGINARVVKPFAVGEAFPLSHRARVARVGDLLVRLQAIGTDRGPTVTVTASLPGRAAVEVVLELKSDAGPHSVPVGDYRLALVDVAGAPAVATMVVSGRDAEHA